MQHNHVRHAVKAHAAGAVHGNRPCSPLADCCNCDATESCPGAHVPLDLTAPVSVTAGRSFAAVLPGACADGTLHASEPMVRAGSSGSPPAAALLAASCSCTCNAMLGAAQRGSTVPAVPGCRLGKAGGVTTKHAPCAVVAASRARSPGDAAAAAECSAATCCDPVTHAASSMHACWPDRLPASCADAAAAT